VVAGMAQTILSVSGH